MNTSPKRLSEWRVTHISVSPMANKQIKIKLNGFNEFQYNDYHKWVVNTEIIF
uniref:Uncharacterized protein n=1 Tax=Rhizophagus irregularis (strain DAOM 181602 / DAOM 197198 / MUCL 43194) TaxID=747089 RepID=U9SLN7_RHIID